MPPKLAIAAKYVIDNPADFALGSIRHSAQKAGVSGNTFVRLAALLGYDSFETLRDPLRSSLVTEGEHLLGTGRGTVDPETSPTAARQTRAAQNALNVVSRSLRNLSPELVTGITETLTTASRSYVTATRASYALAYYFHYVGRMALPELELVPRHMGAAVDDLMGIGADDCLIAMTFAPYSSGTIQALRHATSKGARVILISDSAVIAPDIRAEHTVVVSANSLHPFGAYSGAMAVLDCLLSHVIDASGDAGLKRLEDYEQLRQETGAYWKEKRLPHIKR